MNLAQMYALANSKSGYSRSDVEIWAALDRAGFRVYSAVLKEFRGFFLKFDETSLVLTPTQTNQEYTLPVDFSQMVHLAERVSSTQNWRPMQPVDIDTTVSNLQDSLGWDDFYSAIYGFESLFGYYGPYLDSVDTTTTQPLQIQKIRVTPTPTENHFCQIAYTAKWLPITDGASKLMLPDEGTHAMESFAAAELNAMNDDSRAGMYESQGATDLAAFLVWVRNRQIQTVPTIDPYGPSEW